MVCCQHWLVRELEQGSVRERGMWRDLGEGARAAAGRRQQALLEEERRRRDRVAHYQAHLRGRGVPWAGEIFHRH